MDAQKLVMGIVGLAVMVMVITAVVLPTVQNAQNEQVTEYNNTVETYLAASPTEVNLEFVPGDSAGTTFSINGKDYTVANGTFVMISDNVQVRYISSNNRLALVDTDYPQTSNGITVTTLVITNGSYVLNEGLTNEYTGTVKGTVYVVSDVGKYGLYGGDTRFAVDADSEFSMFIDKVLDTNTGLRIFASITGNPVDGFTVNSLTKYTTADGFAAGDPDDLSVNFYTDSLKLVENGSHYTWNGRISYVYDNNGVDITVSSQFSTWYAPLAYTDISDANDTIRVLFGLIPLLLIIVVVLYAVRLMGSRN